MSEIRSSVITCPQCGRVNGMPSNRETFECMFCGAPIQATSSQGYPTAAKPDRPPDETRMEDAFPRIAGLDPAMSQSAPILERAYPMSKTHGTRLGFSLGLVFSLAVLVYSGYRISKEPPEPLAWIILSVFFLIFVMGVFYSIAGLLNTTTVRLMADRLEINTGPFPVRRVKTIPLDQIRAFHVREHRHKATTYSLEAELVNGRKTSLMKEFSRAAPLYELAAELTSRLGIAP